MARGDQPDQSENRNGANGPMDRLKGEVGGLVDALGNRAVTSLRDKVTGTTGRLTDYVEGGGGPGLMAAATGAKSLAEGKSPARSMLSAGVAGVKEKITGMFGGGGGKGGKGGSKKLKLTNIVESIDVGVPASLAYNQWTQYSDFPQFTKKVENVDKNKKDEQKTNWKAQVFWSHRTWEATIVEQVPDERIVWRSKGEKGHVDGAVTFHELSPNLTRILLVLEYHPQGLFERTGNLWRAQGRRARLELKHIQRHMMTQSVLHPDEIEGWRGTVHDGEVAESHEDALEREQKEGSERDESRQDSDGQVDDQESDSQVEDSDAQDADGQADEDSEDNEEASRSGQARRTATRSTTRQSNSSRGTARRGSASQGSTRRRTSAAAQRGGGRT
ncbi:MAG TPA: SRPBCC family protein [Streptosporangiaceae bacterium]